MDEQLKETKRMRMQRTRRSLLTHRVEITVDHSHV
jgi:hypothetical protein